LCGLAGVARHPDGDLDLAKLALPELLLSIEQRGRHATGVAIGGRDVEPYIFKVAVTASKVIASTPFENLVNSITPKDTIIQGHTRHATLNNSTKDEAAHPFVVGSVVGAHNGVITNWKEIEKALGADWMVDSQAAFGLLDRHKNPKKALRLLEGYFALSWEKRGELNLIRSSDAMLSCAYLGKYKTLIWNSTKFALEKVLKELGVMEDAFVWETNQSLLYRFDPTLFASTTANGVKIPCVLTGADKTGKSAYRSWGAVTSGGTKPHTLPAPSPGSIADRQQKSFAFNSVEDRVDMLERVIKKLASRLQAAEAELESTVAEVEHMMNLMVDAGMYGDDKEEVIVCSTCHKEADPRDPLIETPEGDYVHSTCLFLVG
jgi:hypothetical protein